MDGVKNVFTESVHEGGPPPFLVLKYNQKGLRGYPPQHTGLRTFLEEISSRIWGLPPPLYGRIP